MRHVKWIFVVLLICSLTAFVEKDKPTGGLSVGDVAPDFRIESTSGEQRPLKLADLKGRYVLLSFWASYDAQSRMQNVSLNNALRSDVPMWKWFLCHLTNIVRYLKKLFVRIK